MSDDKLPPGTIIRSEDFMRPLRQPPLRSDPAWATVKRALVKHPLLAVRAARMLMKQHRSAMGSAEGEAVMAAMYPAVEAAEKAAPGSCRTGEALDRWLRVMADHIREHGVVWRP